MMTRLVRVLFYLLLAALLIAGLYTGLRIYFILFLCGILTVVSVLILNLYTIYSFKFDQSISPVYAETDEVPDLQLALYNENFFPLSILRIQIQLIDPQENDALTFSLSPFSSKSFSIPVHIPYCGTFSVGMTKISIFDVFDLVPFRFDMRRLSYYRLKTLTVLPKAYHIDAIPGEISDAKAFAELKLRTAEQGDNFSDLRGYRPGDPIKRIHFKKSAQHHTLYVKQYDMPQADAVTLYIDTTMLRGDFRSVRLQFHTVCECAATVALRALRRRKAVRLIFSDGPSQEFVCKQQSELDLLRRALVAHSFESPEEHLVDAFPKTMTSLSFDREIYLFSARQDDAFLQVLERASMQMKHLLLIHINGHPIPGQLRRICITEGGDVAAALSADAT